MRRILMMLATRLLRALGFLPAGALTPVGTEVSRRHGAGAKKVLNVGGNNREIPLPAEFQGWEHLLLDIDPRGNPDIVCDARELVKLNGAQFDALYCSHNLEHYYPHDVGKVLAGFLHVLKPDGFAYIRVPDMGDLMQTVAVRKLDINDFLYESPAGPITVRDVIYGYGVEIERSGNDFFAHKTGFTQKSLVEILKNSGFSRIFAGTGNLEIVAIAFKNEPDEAARKLLKLSLDE
jgi:SAM-dependent methyltransferase